MNHNRHHLKPRLESANARDRKFSRHRLRWQIMMVVGLLSVTLGMGCSVHATVHAAAPDATVHAEAPDAIVATLENARRDLERNTALEARTAVGLEKLKQNGQTPADVITDYEAYFERVRAMVAENRRLVQQLESLRLQSTLPAASPQASEAQALTDAPIPEENLTDEVSALDRELNASLAAFDDMLLEELELIREKSSPKMDSLAQDAADAAERLRQKGIDIDADMSEAESDTQSERSQSETDAGASERKGDPDSAATSTDPTAEGVEGERNKRTERYDGSDDDIVARQLREAAEQETDPVLKEKLWREYEAYKRSGK